MAEIRLTGEGATLGHLEKIRKYLELPKTAFEAEEDIDQDNPT